MDIQQNETCFQCKRNIQNKAVLETRYNRYYHQEHFNCSICENSLLKGYVYKNKNIYCKRCSSEIDQVNCFYCLQKIDDDYKQVNQNYFHDQCIQCFECKQVIEENVLLSNGQLYCEGCYSKKSEKCFVCKQVIYENMMETVDGIVIHKQCFKCCNCMQDVKEDEEFIPWNNKLYHEDCFLQMGIFRCGKCKKNINGHFYEFQNERFHLDCI